MDSADIKVASILGRAFDHAYPRRLPDDHQPDEPADCPDDNEDDDE
jgi:hypothetical protein